MLKAICSLIFEIVKCIVLTVICGCLVWLMVEIAKS